MKVLPLCAFCLFFVVRFDFHVLEIQQVTAHIVGIDDLLMAAAGFETNDFANSINRNPCFAETDNFRITGLVLLQAGNENFIVIIFGAVRLCTDDFLR